MDIKGTMFAVTFIALSIHQSYYYHYRLAHAITIIVLTAEITFIVMYFIESRFYTNILTTFLVIIR